ncbi:gluconate 5-dehydrogenase [candidate division KSB3 bacterium]|uniref:Gluconate 5-dehydrogenase n=1 Tax=candidate division KSB3 bacterium TaxID=2044937 RepID=A0A2G6EFV4_9BACT|nr:MAG: gluconate 5-dehydrogenase [candidate division KSB3 bacterium]PIE31120.1 MAG: gluconate 5-dehydrogenase [candidate division KSB3 bacterium]
MANTSKIQDLFSLHGKIALVTGSYQGLGLVLARGLAQAGATVVLNGRKPEKLDNALKQFSEEGLRAYGYTFDVTNAEQIQTTIPKIEEHLGPIDILVNNAGIQRRGSLEEIEESAWREVLDTNLTGVFLVSRQVVKTMIARKAGKIINIGSLQSEISRSTIAPYAASKGGLKMLTRGMAVDWGKYNIQCNGIGPGYYLSDMTQALADDPTFDSWLKARTPMRRWGDQRELVGAVIFLASAASSFVNGHMLYVDGGILATI